LLFLLTYLGQADGPGGPGSSTPAVSPPQPPAGFELSTRADKPQP